MVGSTEKSIADSGRSGNAEAEAESGPDVLAAISREHRRRTSCAVAALRSSIRDGDGNGATFIDIVEGWIDEAMLRGLIKLDDSGFAIANNPAQAHVADIPEDHPERAEEYRRRLAFGSKLRWVDPEQNDEACGDTREIEALSALLKLGHAQTYAQAMLGAEMAEVPIVFDLTMQRLDPAVTCVANRTFRGVARVTLDAVRPLLEEETKQHAKVEAWQAGLQLAMMQLTTSELRGTAAVRYVLDAMALAGGELHGNFGKGMPHHMKEAARVLRTMEKAGGKGYKVTLREKPGPGWSRPWGAAQRFAKAFGITLPNEAEMKRDRTAERARNSTDTDRAHAARASRKMPPCEARHVDRGDHRPPRRGRDSR